MYGVAEEDDSDSQRRTAKVVNFGIMYGAGAHKISDQVTKDRGSPFSQQQAQEVIDKIETLSSKIQDLIDVIIKMKLLISKLFLLLMKEKT